MILESSTRVETILSDPARPAILSVPAQAKGLVIFAHGARSSIASGRNSHLAESLAAAGFATLLFDLLLPEESRKHGILFDAWLLASRLRQATQWARRVPDLVGLPLGYFGSSTGAAAALVGAADDHSIRAIVCRGARVDLAGRRLSHIRTPTLLLVGGEDTWVLSANRAAAAELAGEKELGIIEGAGHEFDEAGAIDQVASAAQAWFLRFMITRHRFPYCS